jgi:hypothetical protein
LDICISGLSAVGGRLRPLLALGPTAAEPLPVLSTPNSWALLSPLLKLQCTLGDMGGPVGCGVD